MGRSKAVEPGKVAKKSKKDKAIAEPSAVAAGVFDSMAEHMEVGEQATRGIELGTTYPTVNQEEVEESSTSVRLPRPTMATNGVTAEGVNRSEIPTAREMWDQMRAMMAQFAIMTGAFAPGATEQTVGERSAGVEPEKLPEVVEVLSTPSRINQGKVDYLTQLEHVSKLGTRQFMGTANPLEADKWRNRLVRNFESTRCPEDYRKDIAVHFLEGDAHDWWMAIEKQRGQTTLNFEDFKMEFHKKYFPSEAYDRLECQFLELVQGSRTVREYEGEFNRLRRYVGRELEDVQAQVRRFMRGLKYEIRIHCTVRTFGSVSELVERAAMIEADMEAERKLNRPRPPFRNNLVHKPGENKRKWDRFAGVSKTTSSIPECRTCGKRHLGECFKIMGACFRCGSRDHRIHNCPQINQERRLTGGEPKTCFHCGKDGHYRSECPKLQVERRLDDARNRAVELPPPPKRQAGTARVFELSKEAGTSGHFSTIAGESLSQL